MTRKRVLLVEGTDDKEALGFLIREAIGFSRLAAGSVEIDTAQILQSPPGVALGNRQKVETVYAEVSKTHFRQKLVCFVDREYTGFDVDGLAETWDAGNLTEGRLIRSHGHSIENYFFDIEILCEHFEIVVDGDVRDGAIQGFSQVFVSALRIALAASLAGLRVGYLDAISKSFDVPVVRITDSDVDIDEPHWRLTLSKKMGFTDESVSAVVAGFRQLLPRVAATDPAVVRWMCHGHISLSLLCCVFGQCAARAGHTKPDFIGRLSLDSTGQLFRTLARVWARRALSNEAIYPSTLISLLGL